MHWYVRYSLLFSFLKIEFPSKVVPKLSYRAYLDDAARTSQVCMSTYSFWQYLHPLFHQTFHKSHHTPSAGTPRLPLLVPAARLPPPPCWPPRWRQRPRCRYLLPLRSSRNRSLCSLGTTPFQVQHQENPRQACSWPLLCHPIPGRPG